MSRGERVAVTGNLFSSMRNNYGEYGVAEYYKKVGSTYRNPHYPGIRLTLFAWLNKWWKTEHEKVSALKPNQIMLFDMACGSGEVTLAFIEWCKAGKKLYHVENSMVDDNSNVSAVISRRKPVTTPIALGPDFPKPQIAAADPFTSAAFQERTGFSCAKLAFEDIAEGILPKESINIVDGSLTEIISMNQQEDQGNDHYCQIEMVICSFAMHLIENSSSLFTLLWELGSKARWLVILAPHKKPEIKSGWGWNKWDIETWNECEITSSAGELLHDRVHCRVYRSVNF